jgi:hypothetical protein
MQNLHQAIPQSQPANQKRAQLPYDALETRCPMCRAYAGFPCVSSRRKRIRYPHHQRIEFAAADYRSTVRLQILGQIRGPHRLGDRDRGPRFTSERVP